MRLHILAVAACALFAVTSAALADTHIGWYVAADVGPHQRPAQKLTVTEATIESSSFSSQESSSSSTSGGEGAPQSAPAQAAVTSPDAYTGPYGLHTRSDTAIFLRGGYQFTPNWRTELELGQRAAKINHSLATGAYTDAEARGSQDADTAMVNVIYDIAPAAKLHPYLGLGVGAVRIKTNYNGTVSPGAESYVTQSYAIHSTKTVAGAQALAGLTWAVTHRLNIDLTYRYLQTSKVSYDVDVDRKYYADVSEVEAPRGATNARVLRLPNAAAATQVGEVLERDRMSGRFNDQSLSIGLRWAFGPESAPPPAAVPYTPSPSEAPTPPAPEVPQPQAVPLQPAPPAVIETRAFIVYFEFDKSSIPQDGLTVIEAASDYSKAGDAKEVNVVGHADTSGSAAYNIALSRRRAQAVKDVLVHDGVAANIVNIAWKGESQPAVATADGVKEPLNRRAEIDIQF